MKRFPTLSLKGKREASSDKCPEKDSDNKKAKSPARLIDEASLLSKKVSNVSEENTQRALDLQTEETGSRAEEIKRNNAAIAQLLGEFGKKDPAEVCIEKEKKSKNLREDSGEEVTDDKLEKLKKNYLSKNEI